MRIFVFGNINAGKSYFISKLKENQFSDYPVLSIDDYRKTYGDNTIQKELLAQDKFVEDVYKTNDSIVECTGLGPLGKNLHDKQPFKNDVILHINTSVNICIDRLKDKDFNQIPYPTVEETLENTIRRCGNEFDNNDLYKLWSDKILHIFEVELYEDIYRYPINTINTFSDILTYLNELDSIKTIYLYGSMARNEMNLHSDIDCFIVSKEIKSDDLKKILKDKFDSFEYSIIGNKVTVRKNDKLLMEFVVLRNLVNGERYIKESNLDNLKHQIVKINDIDAEYLHNLVINNDKPIDSTKYLINEMIYFVKSLPKLIEQNNRYKYYFHFNIILHNYIRVNEIIKGNILYNYLPKVNYEEYQDLVEYKKDNLLKHYNYVVLKTEELLRILN